MFKVIFDFVNILFIINFYSYQSFPISFSAGKYILSWVVFAGIVFVLNYIRDNEPFDILVLLFTLFLLFPLLTTMSFHDKSPVLSLLALIMLTLFALGQKYAARIPDILSKLGLFRKPARFLLMAFCATVVVYSVIALMVQNDFMGKVALDITRIYEIRSHVRMSTVLGYTFSLATKSIIPFAICIALLHRKWVLLGASVLVQMVFYLYTGNRYVLFLIPAIIGIMVLQKIKGYKLYAVLGVSAVMLVTGFARLVSNQALWALSWLNRLFGPASYLHYLYYDFANKYGTVHYAESHLGALLGEEPPYPKPTSIIISLTYDGAASNANTGMLATAYLDDKLAGVLLVSALAAACFMAMKRVYSGKLSKIYLPLLVSPAFACLNTNFLTVLISGGLLCTIFLGFLYRLSANEVSVGSTGQDANRENRSKILFTKKRILCLAVCLVFAFITTSYAGRFGDIASKVERLNGEISGKTDLDPYIDDIQDIRDLEIMRADLWRFKVSSLVSQSRNEPTDYGADMGDLQNALADCSSLKDPGIVDKALYVRSCLLLEGKGIALNPEDRDKAAAYEADLINQVNKYEEMSRDEQFMVFQTLLDIRKIDDELVQDPLSVVVAYWFREIDAGITNQDAAMLAGLFHEYGGEGLASQSEDMQTAVDMAASLYQGVLAERDTRMPVPIWSEGGEPLSLADHAQILYGIEKYEAYSRSAETNYWLLTIEDTDMIVMANSTYRQIAGSFALYYYQYDHSYREESWLNGNYNIVDGTTMISERAMIYVIDYFNEMYPLPLEEGVAATTKKYLRMGEWILVFYKDGYEKGTFENPFVYLFFVSNELEGG